MTENNNLIDKQKSVHNAAWAACDAFRGILDATEYKNYILSFLFLKYLSDWHDHIKHSFTLKYKDPALVKRKMQRERFVLPDHCHFDFIATSKTKDNIGELINTAITDISVANPEKLEGVFMGVDFNSEKFGTAKEKGKRMQNLINAFSSPDLDFKQMFAADDLSDIIGSTYMYLVEKFATGAGKSGGEFFTPPEVSELVARLADPQPGHRIYDPTAGSASLVMKVAELLIKEHKTKDFSLYGQEVNQDSLAMSKMNLFLHDLDAYAVNFKRGDTILEPAHTEQGHLMQFNRVVANPPFSLDKWGADRVEDDKYHRFDWGIPPKSKGDMAFLSHMIASADEQDGRVVTIVPHGVLFRGSSEGRIRQKWIEENLLEAVIGLPSNLFYGTSIAAAIMIFNKNKGDNTDVLFVDASGEDHYLDGKKQNKLREQDVAKVVEAYNTYRKGASIGGETGEVIEDKYAYRATIEEIKENDFNCNIPRYVDTFEEPEPVDLDAVKKEIQFHENEAEKLAGEMEKLLKELGI